MVHHSDLHPNYELTGYKSIKEVHAGEIVDVFPNGCLVLDKNGMSKFMPFQPKMIERYHPVVGDYWIVYDEDYQSISPRKVFLTGYQKK